MKPSEDVKTEDPAPVEVVEEVKQPRKKAPDEPILVDVPMEVEKPKDAQQAESPAEENPVA